MIGGFYIYGLNIYFCFKFKIGNEDYITYNNVSSIDDFTVYIKKYQSKSIIIVEKDNFNDKEKSSEM